MTSARTTGDDHYVALGHKFVIGCDHPGVKRWLRRILIELASPDEAPRDAMHYELRLEQPGHHELRCDGEPIVDGPDPSAPIAHLLHRINLGASAASRDQVLLHAGAVSASGRGVILAGAMESGKSTLTTALVQAGADYLSDEFAAVKPNARSVARFARAISLDPGAWPLFPDLAPRIDATTAPFLPRQWQLPPAQVGEVGPAATEIAVIVSWHRIPGAEPRIEQLDPVEALKGLLSASFTVEATPHRDLATLGGLVASSRCMHLTFSDVHAGARLLLAACEA